MNVTTVTLELVRHGPVHNQLLSSLTPYLALAGNRPVETVHVPAEHAQVLAKLRRLHVFPRGATLPGFDAADQRAARDADVRDAAHVVSTLLASVRGLTEAVTEAIARAEHAGAVGLIHLRLILSAAELALLPFELAQGPLTLGGADGLGVVRPPEVVITRDSRRSSTYSLELRPPTRMRVLLACADPRGVGLPVAACLLALRRSFPGQLLRDSNDEVANKFRERVVLYTRASLAGLRNKLVEAARERCAYTHVFVLAHGDMPRSVESVPTILLHGDRADATPDEERSRGDAVSGDRLAATVAALTDARPDTVALLACGAGHSSRVLFAGGSLAHSVHEAGVPLVIASQFPLSFAGAAVVTEKLMDGAWRNEHPAAVVAEIRRELFAELPDTHDWGGVVAYATLPDESQQQRRRAELRRFGHVREYYQALSHLVRETRETDDLARSAMSQRFSDALRDLASYLDDVLREVDRRDGRGLGVERGRPSSGEHYWENEGSYSAADASYLLTLGYLRQAVHLSRSTGQPTSTVANALGRPEVADALRRSLRYSAAHRRLGGCRPDAVVAETLVRMLHAATPRGRARAEHWWMAGKWLLANPFYQYDYSAEDRSAILPWSRIHHCTLGFALFSQSTHSHVSYDGLCSDFDHEAQELWHSSVGSAGSENVQARAEFDRMRGWAAKLFGLDSAVAMAVAFAQSRLAMHGLG